MMMIIMHMYENGIPTENEIVENENKEPNPFFFLLRRRWATYIYSEMKSFFFVSQRVAFFSVIERCDEKKRKEKKT